MGVLVPEDPSCRSYRGFLTAPGDRQFLVRVTNVVDASLKDAGLEMDPQLSGLLAAHMTVVSRRLQQSPTLSAFMNELTDLATSALRMPTLATDLHAPALSFFETLLEDIAAVGWDRIAEVTTDAHGHWNGLQVNVPDAKGRVHVVSFQMNADYPRSAPRWGADVPEPLPPLQWFPTSTLTDALDQMAAVLAKYQSFWDVLDDIDKKCCVLEPHRPTRACKRRRLAVVPQVSLQFEIADPLAPRALVDVVWFGNEATVGPLREALYRQLSKWRPADDLRKNLQRVLGLTFPSPKSSKLESFQVECGICYAYRLEDGGTPDRVCDHPPCARPFHHSCLLEWLKAIATSRKSFQTIFGECPYCREPISAKL
ncbi:Fanconi anemia, complementation group L [Achlya hypogyna]|uniref:Fanconi anemia, complementation group L n=1 Tax=Achlya hypogyna TaxID=1202772 RepID=A0A1V9Z663_ACHHY|nr:Fanconi anemia, complementation group L [Achlya hypogyna]